PGRSERWGVWGAMSGPPTFLDGEKSGEAFETVEHGGARPLDHRGRDGDDVSGLHRAQPIPPVARDETRARCAAGILGDHDDVGIEATHERRRKNGPFDARDTAEVDATRFGDEVVQKALRTARVSTGRELHVHEGPRAARERALE